MNKRELIKKLSKELKTSESKATLINDVFEDHFLFGRKNKDKIIKDLVDKVKVSETEADKIYNKFMDIFSSEIKNKIIHPFKSDK